MPYIITPGIQTTDSGTNFESVAAATLDDAKVAVESALRAYPEQMPNAYALFQAGSTLLESGGTIGPLPDGYVIDVQRKSWDELADLAGYENPSPGRALATFAGAGDIRAGAREAILDAYNQN